jgi:hypothetical protein
VRDATRLVNLFKEKGFTLHRHTNHLIWNCPCGHAQVTSPKTPGEGRAMKNIESQIARTLRGCTTP